ncbi:MAG: glycogen/starch/alpha-glucan phosphorylase [Pseudomonadota bacterium]
MNQVATGLPEKNLADLMQFHLHYSLGLRAEQATTQDWFRALALATRNHIIDRMFSTETRYQEASVKRLYYLSMEFLTGRLLTQNLINLGMLEEAKTTLQKLGIEYDELEDTEVDAALGNGGLGRLAACFLDSMASLDMPGFGYGINYEYGLFRQGLENGHQQERPDHWLHEDAPWLLERADEACVIPYYGRLQYENGQPKWTDWQVLVGVPFDMPVVGYGGHTVNYLRLFSARSSEAFDIEIFNGGDYMKAVEQKISSENVSKVLYPSDSCWGGKELRLVQEYFLVACSLRDMIRRHMKHFGDIHSLPANIAIQLNDTHPALTIAELMNILINEYQVSWDEAWEITQSCCAYTNHTLLPEALEKWPVFLLESVLPLHLHIIYEINSRFLEQVSQRWPGDVERLQRLSLVEEGHEKQIRMAHLAIVGSHSVNGVAALHSELIKSRLVPDFYEFWPEKFNNKTNGVTPRRWIMQSNPALAELLDETAGEGWVTDLEQLQQLEQYTEDSSFQATFNSIKRANKKRLARYIFENDGPRLDVDSMFDIQIKRIHEYKRQLLNILHVIHQYFSIVEDGRDLPVPKTYIFAGKAPPGYVMAKRIIKLINSVAEVVNNDPRVREQLKVAFVVDYRVSLAEIIIPAANLSEQISTAGTEASGTGNMKFAMNGALTIGTLDGANVEIREEVGEDNIYIFGLTTPEVEAMREQGSYDPRAYYQRSDMIRRVMDSLKSDLFCPNEPGLFMSIFDTLLHGGDYFFYLADLESYAETHMQAAQDFRKTHDWTRRAILNVARMGKFSSDRTIREYAEDIWKIKGLT